ncbi:CubicO group peptidase, beta-lactamase class C family [Nocardia farcinica]|uniref:D-alanyl-D-alanine carboxypeptidase n=1 Tax=Nocardia farcinica TaxID=37329 RepID=A0A0H5NQ70_NOCFR|nr:MULTISPECIES: serine hydrolase domain-containing protein [Nocardia]AXK85586.1 class A beta-lactamase-related serine hydrolase [Nocardia farcinica]MBF6189325.1 beta-lactamase family protein [Nocardia farcinica]MBF6247268.1 beta-lactamase family protein [Nocardia elegans]MBF6315081.1 beta-lactamase family protein [Nocardia farcinica]MBF6411351.1 beta-lactamase family protein [Nocardia farcinica]
MSNDASVHGSAPPEFGQLVRVFGRTFGRRPGAGAALAIHVHGEPLVDIWTGEAGTEAWTREHGTLIFSATKGVAATAMHRLADRGLLDYNAPVAEYWPEFAANGKSRITVRQVMTHSAGLSALSPLVEGFADVLDHELMEERLAAAKPDRLLGVPTYHALTYGWLLAGLARRITGKSMSELLRTEVSEPLGIDGPHLGHPPAEATTRYAPLAGNQLGLLGTPLGNAVMGRGHLLPGPLGAAVRCLFLPGVHTILEGEHPPILRTELAAGNGVATASALARVYDVLACGGVVDGKRYLSAATMREIAKVRTYRLDHALFYLPMMWHLGYHSLPMPGARSGLGHIGLGGSFGWADPRLGLSVGFVHNRLSASQLGPDQLIAVWLLPLILTGLRGVRRGTAPQLRRAA